MPTRQAVRIAGYSISANVLAFSQENRRFLSCHGQISRKSLLRRGPCSHVARQSLLQRGTAIQMSPSEDLHFAEALNSANRCIRDRERSLGRANAMIASFFPGG